MPNYGEYTYSEIAEELGVSRERVRQIEKEALKKLAARFRQMGYDKPFSVTSSTLISALKTKRSISPKKKFENVLRFF